MANTGSKMNMTIAKTHRLSSRLVGMQLTAGNLIGILLSMVQMSLGFVTLTEKITQGLWYMKLSIGLVGCLLALLIERLSIGGLSSVREASEERKRIEDAFYARAIRKEPSKWEVENKDRQVKALNRRIRIGWCFGGGGMLLSTVIGDTFWRMVFASLGPWYEVVPMSLACACVIGITFVHSELFKTDLDKVIKAILRDFGVMRAAAGAEAPNMQLDMMVSAMETVRDDGEVRAPVEAKIGRVVVRQLSQSADRLATLALDDPTTVVESSVSTPLQITAPKRRSLYQTHRDELRQLLTADPNVSLTQIADHFGKSKATVQNWVEKLKAGI
jgi:hypothetical protein